MNRAALAKPVTSTGTPLTWNRTRDQVSEGSELHPSRPIIAGQRTRIQRVCSLGQSETEDGGGHEDDPGDALLP